MRAKLRESQELTDKTGNGFPHQIWKVDSPRQPADDLIPFGRNLTGQGDDSGSVPIIDLFHS